MDIEDFIYKEQVRQSNNAALVIEMLKEFKKELSVMPEFDMKTARYIAYSVSINDTQNPIKRYAFRTLKNVTELSEGSGGLYNHSFKWRKLDGHPKVSWSYVNSLKGPLIAVAVLRYNVTLGELRDNPNGEAAI